MSESVTYRSGDEPPPRLAAVRRLVGRAQRAKRRRFLVEGPQAVREALAYHAGDLVEVYWTPDAARRHTDLVSAAEAAGTTVTVVPPAAMAGISDTVTPQGVVGICRFLDTPLRSVVASRPRLVVLLAHVRDPGNAGTVLRTADAAGADAVILSDASVDVYNPKCVRASAGSLFHLPVVVGVDIDATIASLREHGLRVLAADGHGATDLDDEVDTGRLAAPTCWLFGNEAWGLPSELRAAADATVRVPIHGRAESLNLATAAAVCLYTSARAHRVSTVG